MNSLVEALKGTERDTGLNPDELTELSQYYARIRPIYKQFESGMDAPNTEIYKYEIPGGQYSNLLAQVKEMGAAEDFEEIKGLYKDANQLLGNIVKVTPSSKVVGDFAIFMFKNGLTKENILEVGERFILSRFHRTVFQGCTWAAGRRISGGTAKDCIKRTGTDYGTSGNLTSRCGF